MFMSCVLGKNKMLPAIVHIHVSCMTRFYFISDASLSQWLADKQIEHSDLDRIPRFQLMEYFGIAAYQQEMECYQQAYPYIPSTDGWNQGR